MLESLLISMALAIGVPGSKDQERQPTPEYYYQKLPDTLRKSDASSLYYGFPVADLKARFGAAMFNAFSPANQSADWFWVVRAFGDLGLKIDLKATAEEVGADPAMLEQLRLNPSSPVTNRRIKAFYDQAQQKILAKKTMKLNMEDGYLMVGFVEGCSQAKQALNEKIYLHLSGLAAKALKAAGREHHGGFDMLVELRDRGCLSENQYKKLAAGQIAPLRAKMKTMVPAEYVRAVYYLLHGGFASAVSPDDIVRVAEGQGIDGNWGPDIKRKGPATPIYGAYVWAYVLTQGGTPVSFMEFEAAKKSSGGLVR